LCDVPPPSLPPFRTAGDRADISIRDAALCWLAGWFLGSLVGSIVLSLSGASKIADAGPGWFFAAAIAQWIPMIGALVYVGRRFGTGDVRPDFGLTFRPADLLGIPIGVVTQLVVVRLVYLPLEAIWPDTFTLDKIEERARTTFDSAHGGGVALIVIAVVVGAPLVEELIYRGLLQGAFTRRLSEWIGVVVVALWFAIVHFQPVETPGLFAVGLVLGVCALRARRLGLSVVAHMAFNATGLILVAAT
jgi:hypothetical protein